MLAVALAFDASMISIAFELVRLDCSTVDSESLSCTGCSPRLRRLGVPRSCSSRISSCSTSSVSSTTGVSTTVGGVTTGTGAGVETVVGLGGEGAGLGGGVGVLVGADVFLDSLRRGLGEDFEDLPPEPLLKMFFGSLFGFLRLCTGESTSCPFAGHRLDKASQSVVNPK